MSLSHGVNTKKISIEGMSYTYLSSTLTTMERKFGIKAKELAYLMSGNEISQFLFLFALPFMIRERVCLRRRAVTD